MTEDPRCCGTGTCIINDEGVCWCGQKWDGEKMCFPKPHDGNVAEPPMFGEDSPSNARE